MHGYLITLLCLFSLDGTSEPIQRAGCGGAPFKAEISVAKEKVAEVAKAVGKLSGVKVTAQYRSVRLVIIVAVFTLFDLWSCLQQVKRHQVNWRRKIIFVLI